MFLLVYNHLTSCTGNDCYIQLSEFAENLGLPHVDSPDIDLNDPETRERFLENAEVEMERIRAVEVERQRVEAEAQRIREEEERQRLDEERRRQEASERARRELERQESEVRMQRIAQISTGEEISMDEVNSLSSGAGDLTDNPVTIPEAPLDLSELEEHFEVQS